MEREREASGKEKCDKREGEVCDEIGEKCVREETRYVRSVERSVWCECEKGERKEREAKE